MNTKNDIEPNSGLPKSYHDFLTDELEGSSAWNERAPFFIQTPEGHFEVRRFRTSTEVGISPTTDWDKDYLAIAEDSSGNFFIFLRTNPLEVFFWDHETLKIAKVASNLEDFLSSLGEEKTFESAEPQNAKGWIDPDFFETFRK
jgi:hypothetical protein